MMEIARNLEGVFVYPLRFIGMRKIVKIGIPQIFEKKEYTMLYEWNSSVVLSGSVVLHELFLSFSIVE